MRVSPRIICALALVLALAAVPSAEAKQPKQDICHLDADSGTYSIINVAAPAVPAHIGHGDFLPLTFYADNDGDGYGAGPAFQGCEIPAGFADNDDDCDDTDAAVNPGAEEVCNGIDDDCDAGIDEGLTFDADGDGYTSTDSCEGSMDDCDDGDAAVNPGASEACNGVDDDCDGQVDEGGVCADKVVFVSSALFDGNFGNGQDNTLGHLLADAECQTLASNAGLGGTFKAWISGRVDTGAGPLPHGVVDRFTQNPGPYELLDGTKVADNWADLTDGSLDHAIDRTELNMPVAGELRVWTNTTTSGLAWDNSTNCALGPGTDGVPGIVTWSCGSPDFSPGDCQFQSGKYGMANATNGSWTGTNSSNLACSNVFRLYCFEQ